MPERKGSRSSTVRWYKNPSVVLPALLVAFVLFTQWPAIKLMGYRLLGRSIAADNIPWQRDFAAALNESRQSGKPVLLDFSASWCPPCQIMKYEVWPDSEVEKVVVRKYIPVQVDGDDQAGEAVALRYNVGTIPRILVVDADGHVLKDGAYMDRDEMLKFLDSDTSSRTGTTP